MGVQLTRLELQTRSEPSKAFEQAFETAMLDQIDALIAVEDYLMFTYRTRIVGLRRHEPAPGHLRTQRVRGRRRPHVLWH